MGWLMSHSNTKLMLTYIETNPKTGRICRGWIKQKMASIQSKRKHKANQITKKKWGQRETKKHAPDPD
jgi:hypothetical protein